MTIKFLNNEDTAEFFLEGRLDSNAAPDAEKAILETVEKYNFTTVVLDFENCAYVSSAGLRIFVKLYMTLKKRSGEAIARNVPDNIMDLLEMTGCITLFRLA